MPYQKNKDWKLIEERFQMFHSWKGKMLSVGGRLVLINLVLSSILILTMSFLSVPKGILKKLDYYIFRLFFGQSDEGKKKYRLARWKILCMPECLGGLGIFNLEIQNKCLMSKWVFKLLNRNGLRQTMLKKNYLKNKAVTSQRTMWWLPILDGTYGSKKIFF